MSREALPWRASPVTHVISAVAVRHGLAEPLQPVIGLPLLPADAIGSKYEVIRRVPDAPLPTVLGLIDQLDPGRLIVELEHLLVMLVLVQPRQFDAVALRLDRDPILRLG